MSRRCATSTRFFAAFAFFQFSFTRARIRPPHTRWLSVSRSKGIAEAIGFFFRRLAICQNDFRLQVEQLGVVVPLDGHHHLGVPCDDGFLMPTSRRRLLSPRPPLRNFPKPEPQPPRREPADAPALSYTVASILFALDFHRAAARLEAQIGPQSAIISRVPGAHPLEPNATDVLVVRPPKPKNLMYRSGTDAVYVSPVSRNSNIVASQRHLHAGAGRWAWGKGPP